MDHREFLQRLGALAKSPWPAPKAAQGGRPYGAAYPAFDRSCRRVDGTAALLVGLGPIGGLAVDICRSWQLPGLLMGTIRTMR
jgi:threonine dehydrogenase-like Zn-dependent dehydrogenase